VARIDDLLRAWISNSFTCFQLGYGTRCSWTHSVTIIFIGTAVQIADAAAKRALKGTG
jgi:hypothetical protein